MIFFRLLVNQRHSKLENPFFQSSLLTKVKWLICLSAFTKFYKLFFKTFFINPNPTTWASPCLGNLVRNPRDDLESYETPLSESLSAANFSNPDPNSESSSAVEFGLGPWKDWRSKSNPVCSNDTFAEEESGPIPSDAERSTVPGERRRTCIFSSQLGFRRTAIRRAIRRSQKLEIVAGPGFVVGYRKTDWTDVFLA
jgi:hypothetical protein